MKKYLAAAKAAAARYVPLAARYVWAKYPARVSTYLAVVVIFVATKAGIVVPEASVLHAIEYIVPLIVAGEYTHRKVSPVALTPAS